MITCNMDKKRPLIFITNDDSYFSKGISVLIRLMKQLGDVVVVAPKEEMSGKSHSITSNAPLKLIHMETSEGYEGYILNGTPVDCVKIALNRILKDRKIDLLVSGINHGSNASINTIYSGTMAAVFEGCAEHIPSVGFSIDTADKQADFSFCENIITKISQEILTNGLDDGICLNVNFPVGEIKGTKVCHQAKAYWEEEFVEYHTPHGEPYFWLSGTYHCQDTSAEADYNTMQQSYASIVPMQVDFTAYKALNEIKNRFENVEKR